MVIELVGPAGAGKSAVAAELSKLGVVRAGVWNLPRLLLARSALASGAVLAAMWRDGGRASAAKQVVRLGALEQRVAQLAAHRSRAVVLDEGPVFALTWFRVFSDPQAGNGRLAAWQRGATERWAEALGAVVFLDAPDPLLLRRIRNRTKPRDVFATMTDAAILELQAAYRAAFAQVIPAITGANGAQLVSLDAEHTSAAELAGHVADLLTEHVYGD